MTKFEQFIHSQGNALKTLYGAGHVVPFLQVLYATIDILGFVVAEDEKELSGPRFKAFVGKYMVPHLTDLNESDLWGARCALLHTGTPESSESQKGRAREVLYSRGVADSSLNMKVISQSPAPDRYVAVTLEHLHGSMIDGLEDLARELNRNNTLNQRCIQRVNRFYAHVPVGKGETV
jgi:hypothetical protein